MPNHVHLILVLDHADGLRAALAPAHTRYTMEINRREGWRGHLWQDRFASFPMSEGHLHACLRYVELNPVRAGLAARPEDWPWSSARAHLGLARDGLTDGEAMRERIDDWRAFLDAGLPDDDRDAIRTAERTGRWGSPGTVTSDCPGLPPHCHAQTSPFDVSREGAKAQRVRAGHHADGRPQRPREPLPLRVLRGFA
jgi:putative transposase